MLTRRPSVPLVHGLQDILGIGRFKSMVEFQGFGIVRNHRFFVFLPKTARYRIVI
jgi:hypothetical protein